MTRKLSDRSKNIARIFWFISRSLFGMCRAQTVYRVQENVLASIRNNLKPQITINPARPRPDLNSSLYHRAWIYLNTITSGELSLIHPNREFPSRKINDFVPVPRSQDLSRWNRFLRTIDVQLEIQIFEPKFYSRLKQFYDSFFIPDGYMKLYRSMIILPNPEGDRTRVENAINEEEEEEVARYLDRVEIANRGDRRTKRKSPGICRR